MNEADLDAARLLLARMGITPEQLLRTEHTATTHMPTFREYISQVSDAVPIGTRRAYQTYWQRIIDTWGDRRLDEPTPLEIKKLSESVKACAGTRRTHEEAARPPNTSSPPFDASTDTPPQTASSQTPTTRQYAYQNPEDSPAPAAPFPTTDWQRSSK
jgi:hypothetical protein